MLAMSHAELIIHDSLLGEEAIVLIGFQQRSLPGDNHSTCSNISTVLLGLLYMPLHGDEVHLTRKAVVAYKRHTTIISKHKYTVQC